MTYGSFENLPNARTVRKAGASASNASCSRRQEVEDDPVYVVRDRRWVGLAVVCGLAAGAIAGVVRSASSSPTASATYPSVRAFVEVSDGQLGAAGTEATSGVASTATLPPLSFTATNFYHLRDGKPGLDYPWLKNVKLVEPHRETTLLVDNHRHGFSYRWEIHGKSSSIISTDDAKTSVAMGHEAIVLFHHLDENMITLLEMDETGAVSRQLDEVVMVKYVRREIRTLTDDEREELLDSVSVPLLRVFLACCGYGGCVALIFVRISYAGWRDKNMTLNIFGRLRSTSRHNQM